MKSFSLILLFLSSLFAKDIIAVLDLKPIGLSIQESQILTQRLTTKLVSIGKFKVVERSNMDKILKEQKFQQSGCTDSECAVEIGQLLNTDFIVIGNASKFGSTWALDARLIDVAQGTVLISAEFSKEGKIDVLLTSGISSVTRQLCGMEEIELETKDSKKIEPIIKQSKISSSYNAIGAGFNYGFGTNGYDWNYDIMLSYLLKRNNFGFDVGIGLGKNQVSFETSGNPMHADERIDVDELNSTVYKLGVYYYIYEKNNVSFFTGINYYNISVKLADPWDWVSDGGRFSAFYYSLGINLLDWISLEGGFNISRDNTIKFERINMDPPVEYTGIKYSNIDFKGTIHIPFGYK